MKKMSKTEPPGNSSHVTINISGINLTVRDNSNFTSSNSDGATSNHHHISVVVALGIILIVLFLCPEEIENVVKYIFSAIQ